MKERPILFSGPMVRALLNGSKTQTRRVVKARADKNMGPRCVLQPHELAREVNRGDYQNCPYGQPGDRLWVRETWQGPLATEDDHYPEGLYSPKFCEYAADGGPTPEFTTADDELVCRWRPSIHMPRWASRITLEITGVRVERLQDISEADAIAEGCAKNHNNYYWGGPHKAGGLKQMATARQAYQDLWESINGPGSWDANPWVWVVGFKRVEGGAA